MRINERMELMEEKILRLEKEVSELKAAKAEASGSPVSGLLGADAPKRGRPPKAKKTAETE